MNRHVLYLIGILFQTYSSFATAEAEAVFLLSAGEAEITAGPYSATDTAFKLGSGFKVTDSSGIEIFWTNYGKQNENASFPGLGNRDAKAEIYALAFQYVHFFPIVATVDLTARAGFAFWKSDFVIDGGEAFSDDGIDLIVGAGAHIELAEDWALRIDWEYSEYDDFEVSLATVGFAYYFE